MQNWASFGIAMQQLGQSIVQRFTKSNSVDWLLFTDRNFVWCQRCGFKRGATGELMPIDKWIVEMNKLIEEHRNCTAPKESE